MRTRINQKACSEQLSVCRDGAQLKLGGRVSALSCAKAGVQVLKRFSKSTEYRSRSRRGRGRTGCGCFASWLCWALRWRLFQTQRPCLLTRSQKQRDLSHSGIKFYGITLATLSGSLLF